MKMIVNRYYYSLKDLIDFAFQNNMVSFGDWAYFPFQGTGLGTFLENMAKYYDNNDISTEDHPMVFIESGETPWSSLDSDTKRATMFKDYLWPEFMESPIFYWDKETLPWVEPTEPNLLDVDEEDDPDSYEFHRELCLLFTKIIRWYRESAERYGVMIDNLTNIKNKLLDQLNSENVTLFNDTPQSGGDFVTDPYVTNATKVTSKTDVATPIARLKEVEEDLKNYYADWADEFNRFVMYSL